jgi:hypothetical protein
MLLIGEQSPHRRAPRLQQSSGARSHDLTWLVSIGMAVLLLQLVLWCAGVALSPATVLPIRNGLARTPALGYNTVRTLPC